MDMIVAFEKMSPDYAGPEFNHSDGALAGFLVGYMHAVIAAEEIAMLKLSIASKGTENDADHLEVMRYIRYMGPESCPGDQLTPQQMVLTLKKYLINNPGKWNNPTIMLTRAALADEFPCASK